jgi:hypothetical protein
MWTDIHKNKLLLANESNKDFKTNKNKTPIVENDILIS